MPQITITARSGEKLVVDAEVNQTLMEVIRDTDSSVLEGYKSVHRKNAGRQACHGVSLTV